MKKLLAFALAATLACDSAPTDVDIGDIALLIVSGDGQSGPPNTELPDPLVVKATDPNGNPLESQIVNFVVVEGGGSVFAGSCPDEHAGPRARVLDPRHARATNVRGSSSRSGYRRKDRFWHVHRDGARSSWASRRHRLDHRARSRPRRLRRHCGRYPESVGDHQRHRELPKSRRRGSHRATERGGQQLHGGRQ